MILAVPIDEARDSLLDAGARREAVIALDSAKVSLTSPTCIGRGSSSAFRPVSCSSSSTTRIRSSLRLLPMLYSACGALDPPAFIAPSSAGGASRQAISPWTISSI